MVVWVTLFHIAGLVFWIGGLLVATAMLGQHAAEEFPEGRAALGQAEIRMLNGMANPGAVITIVTGAILASTRWHYFITATWFQTKLVLIACLLALHGITYVRANRFVAGRLRVPRKNWMVLHGAISLVFFLILISVFPGRIYWK